MDDEPLVSPQEDFKVNFHFAILDIAIASMAERFQQLEEATSMFGFLYNISKVKAAITKTLMDDYMNLQHFLSNNEVQAIARRVPKNANPEEVFDFVIK